VDVCRKSERDRNAHFFDYHKKDESMGKNDESFVDDIPKRISIPEV
jgi:hypothetical protein